MDAHRGILHLVLGQAGRAAAQSAAVTNKYCQEGFVLWTHLSQGQNLWGMGIPAGFGIRKKQQCQGSCLV